MEGQIAQGSSQVSPAISYALAMPCPLSRTPLLRRVRYLLHPCYAVAAIAYTPATPCPMSASLATPCALLTQRVALPEQAQARAPVSSAICLRTRYAMCGTDLAYGHDVRY
eukprot:3918213-Rhodomonas_salina.2